MLGLGRNAQAQTLVPPDKAMHIWAGVTVSSLTYMGCKMYIFPNDEKKTYLATITVSSLVAIGKELYDYKTNPTWTIDDSKGDLLTTLFGAGFTIVLIKWEF